MRNKPKCGRLELNRTFKHMQNNNSHEISTTTSEDANASSELTHCEICLNNIVMRSTLCRWHVCVCVRVVLENIYTTVWTPTLPGSTQWGLFGVCSDIVIDAKTSSSSSPIQSQSSSSSSVDDFNYLFNPRSGANQWMNVVVVVVAATKSICRRKMPNIGSTPFRLHMFYEWVVSRDVFSLDKVQVFG